MTLEDTHHDTHARTGHTAQIISYAEFLRAMARRDADRAQLMREEDPYAWAYRFGMEDPDGPTR